MSMHACCIEELCCLDCQRLQHAQGSNYQQHARYVVNLHGDMQVVLALLAHASIIAWQCHCILVQLERNHVDAEHGAHC